MVQIKIDNGTLRLEVMGIHKVFALKSHLEFPLSSVCGVRIEPQLAARPLGLRAPGTYIPRWITAGTFYHEKKRWFWDVANPDNSIIIELEGEKYQVLVVEVEKPGAIKKQLEAARTR